MTIDVPFIQNKLCAIDSSIVQNLIFLSLFFLQILWKSHTSLKMDQSVL